MRYRTCALVGLGGLFAGVTGPLVSAFLPPLVADAMGAELARRSLGDIERTAIGAVMAIDNVLLLLLVPWAGAVSDRATARGGGRMPLVLAGFVLASLGMAVVPWAAAFGLAGLVGAMVLLHTGINLPRAPFQALVADLIPSRDRPLATGSVTLQMCAGAIVFLMIGRLMGMRPAFLVAAGTVLAIAGACAAGLRESRVPTPHASAATFQALGRAIGAAVRGDVPGMRAVFAASFLLQLTFQTFSTWFALHGTGRFGVPPENVTVGFIAWAVGGAVAALPAGIIGVRIGRRRAMLLGFALMAAALFALDRATDLQQVPPLLALASAGWALPMVNAYPLFIEPIPPERRGVLAALFLLCMALGGVIGDPLNGRVFDLAGSYRPLFLLMAGYATLALVAVLFVPRGAGEAEAAPDVRPWSG